MVRLPKPGGDQNIWGDVLNEFLSVEHMADGTLKKAASIAAKADKTYVDQTFLGDDGALFAYGFNVGTDKGYVIRLNAATRQLQFFYGSGATGFTANTYCFDRKFLVFRYNGSDKIKINVGDTVTDIWTGISPKMASGGSFIGTRDNTGRFLAATVGNQFLYDRELTDHEVYNIYHNKQYTSGALFIYNLAERTGTTATDSSESGNNGTIIGGTYGVSPFGVVTKQPPHPTRLEAALTNADSRIASVVAVGTSTTQGGVTTTVNRRYANTLGAIWQRGFNAGGLVAGFHTRALDWAFTGSWSESITGLGISSALLSTGATMSYTTSCTGIELHYVQGPGQGTFTLTIDGGAPIAITPSTAGAAGRHDGMYLSGTLAYGSHTFVVTATNACIINGAYFNNADRAAGVRLYNGGHGGFNTNDFVTSSADSQWTRINTLAPAAVILMITSNDFTSSLTLTNTKANILYMVRKIKSIVTTNPDIVLVQQHRRFDYVGYGTASTFDQYGAVLKDIAASEERVYHIDLSSLFPLANDTIHDPEDLMHTDNIHMTDAGHRFTAFCMARAFVPDVAMGFGV